MSEERAESFGRHRHALILRTEVRQLFDDIDLTARDSTWIDRDSFDSGVLSVARWLLDRADKIEAGEE